MVLILYSFYKPSWWFGGVKFSTFLFFHWWWKILNYKLLSYSSIEFPPPPIWNTATFSITVIFWIYFSCSFAQKAVLWGVGRVGKIVWRPLSNSGPAKRSPAQIRKLELIRPLSSDMLSSGSEYSTSWHHLNLLLHFSSYFFGLISGFTISQRKTPLNHLSLCSLFFYLLSIAKPVIYT